MLPSGAITGDDDELSVTAPSPARFVEGSTPTGAPSRQPPGEPFGGSQPPFETGTPQPS